MNYAVQMSCCSSSVLWIILFSGIWILVFKAASIIDNINEYFNKQQASSDWTDNDLSCCQNVSYKHQ